ncbi:GNAT family N-acetyltransferase [Streptomyces sp. ME19-01-6]|uniref:GNAT family N-acetyltransferase n=1 Tax=Streptomyces sp. ME19-01-6 TaxID=3028686 RepID=UPI0029B65D5D|nr:GNAT family N-acetyltransferase [Streptomyces sp. ME19-01-6]MDX3232534.1 GNAT family N-acetyltransferase [Streptomyces sp. ME19-01-6]
MAVSGRPRALYQRIADKLRAEIADGTLGSGSRLPTEAEIAAEWDTTRSTAVQGLRVLVNEGLIVSDRPRGYFVRSRRAMVYRPQAEFRKRPLSPELDAFLTEMAEDGREASQRIEVQVITPPREIRERLRLGEGELVAVRRRVRFVDGVPYNTNDSHFPLSLVHDSEIMNPDDIARGANTVLAELGYEQTRAWDEIQVRMPTPEESDRLQLGPGTPVAVHLCIGYTQDGKPVRAVVNVLPGDRHVIAFERSRPSLGADPLIRQAVEGDIRTVTELWAHAAAWLRDRGIDQWQYPPRAERIKENITAGECWIVEDDGVPIATITVDAHADPDFWTPEEAAEPALYVHRMAIRRDVSGLELGSAMLDWASQRAADRGVQWLRLDAWKGNSGLATYYSSRDFTLVRTVDKADRRSGVLFQRPAGQTRNVGPKLITREG